MKPSITQIYEDDDRTLDVYADDHLLYIEVSGELYTNRVKLTLPQAEELIRELVRWQEEMKAKQILHAAGIANLEGGEE